MEPRPYRYPDGEEVNPKISPMSENPTCLNRIVKKIKILGKSRRFRRRVQHQTAGEVAFLGPVYHDHLEHFALEIGQRHLWSSCASFHASWFPYSLKWWITSSTSSMNFTRASGCLNQKHCRSNLLTNASARATNSGGAGIRGGSMMAAEALIAPKTYHNPAAAASLRFHP